MSSGESADSRPTKRKCSNKDRVRVTRACDACKRKKLRCSGTIPCTGCLRSKTICEYTAEYTRGRLPHIPPLSPPAASPGTHPDELDNVRKGHQIRNPEELDSFVDPVASPEAAHEDLEGHYVGPSSGVSFLLRVQKRLQENVAVSPSIPIFNFGDSPLPRYDPSFLVLPTKDQAKVLIARYFDFAFPTHRFLHRPRAEAWLDEFYERLHLNKAPDPGFGEICALILMVLAQAKQYLPCSDAASGAGVNSILYFTASERHLAAETGPIRLTSVQARLAQCFFLLSESRINHCWSLFGTTARLAVAIGLHRRRRRESAATDLIEQECRRRVFWCAYSLDNYLSSALGRPRSFHDDDIDQELPMCVDDCRLSATAILPEQSHTQSIMLAPVYHARLSKIISGILHDLYGIKQLRPEEQISLATKYETELLQWRQEIASFVDFPSVHLLILIYQRQYNVLNLAYSHAQILLYRPFMLRNFATLTGSSRRCDRAQGKIRIYIQQCLNAAMKIVSIVRELCASEKMYPAFWFTHYYAFCAVVVLYVHTIQTPSPLSPSDIRYFESGEQGQQDLATCGSKSSFAQRYVIILEELRKEANSALEQKLHRVEASVANPYDHGQSAKGRTDNVQAENDPPPCSQPPASKTIMQDPSMGTTEDGTHLVMPDGADSWMDTLLDASPDSCVAELTGWGEFDCLVSTGLGDFGALISTGYVE
ncbi:fungal-specific transcription factor domain-containing protein [Aspergillus ambiguus]|uniref:Zn(II)2Cys6 transcription factor n=1 Tax=Aspergillus ambiguus TaxID=176160 RepID=UPI003CCD7732